MNRTPTSFIYLLLGAILIGAFAVRLYKIANPVADWHSWRQADTASVTYLYVQNGVNLLYPTYFDISSIQTGYQNPLGYRFVEFPFFNVAQATLYNKIGRFSLDEWGRLVSVICSVISTFFLFLLGKRLLGRWGGIWAAFFYAFIPFNVYFTRVILPEAMGAMFAVIGLFAGLEYFEKKRFWKLFISAIFFACALLIKPFLGFYLLPLMYLFFKEYGIRGIFKNKSILLALDLILIPFFLWRGWMDSGIRYLGIPFFNWAFNGDGIRFRPAFWDWIFAERLGKLILGMWGLVIFGVGALHSISKYKFIAFTGFGMVLYVTIIATANVRHDYYQTLTIPAVALLLAAGCHWLWCESPFNGLASKALMTFSIGMMLLIGWYQIRDFYNVNHFEIITAGEAVQKFTPQDAQVIAPYNGDTAFLYQTKRYGWPVVDRSIEEMVELGADYYVSVNYDTDTNNFMKKFKTIDRTDKYIILDLHQPL